MNEEPSLYEGMGIFGHIPTPEEIEAKAFIMPRHAQPQGFWAGYCCALSDAGVSNNVVMNILAAASQGQLAHVLDPIFDDEVE